MCDVEKHIEQWRADLADSDTLSPSDVRELESHLREEIERLKISGLSDNEAFIIARRRLGDTSALEVEFAKAHPHRRLTHQAYWMVVGVLGYLLAMRLSTVAASISGLFGYFVGLRSMWLILLTTTAHITAFALFVAVALFYHARHKNVSTQRVPALIRGAAIVAFAIVGLWWIVALVNPVAYKTMSHETYANVILSRQWAGLGWEMLMPFLLAGAMVILSIRRRPAVPN